MVRVAAAWTSVLVYSVASAKLDILVVVSAPTVPSIILRIVLATRNISVVIQACALMKAQIFFIAIVSMDMWVDERKGLSKDAKSTGLMTAAITRLVDRLESAMMRAHYHSVVLAWMATKYLIMPQTPSARAQ